MPQPKLDSLRVWHIPQGIDEPFYVAVPDVVTAAIVINALAQYDLFQYNNRIKPDYANASGLEIFEDLGGDEGSDWVEWYSDEGESFNDWWSITQ